jgi:Domain of unknown function (DUF1877)
MGMVACFASVDNDTLADFIAHPEKLDGYVEANYDQFVNLDKSWHAIHFTLTGNAEGGLEPLSSSVLGGTEIGEDMGYGPMRYLTTEKVREISARLEQIGIEGFKARFSLDQLAEADIYPSGIWSGDDSQATEYVFSFLPDFLELYQDAAAKGNAILLWIS